MHDQDDRFETRLRAALHDEVRDLPLTVTVDRLERRAAERARHDRFRVLGVAAAAVLGVIAVGTLALLFSRPLPDVAATPSPAVTPTAPAPSESVGPSPSASASTTTRPPLGRVDEAILVVPVGDTSRPTAIEVRLVRAVPGLDPAGRLVATFPGSILPADARLHEYALPFASATGWLALPLEVGPNEDEMRPSVLVVDITDPAAEPWVLPGDGPRMSWGPGDRLAIERAVEILVADPSTRTTEVFSPESGVAVLGGTDQTGVAWLADGTGFGAQREILDSDEAVSEPGVVGLDGRFRPETGRPLWQRSGLEHGGAPDGHSFGQACDSGPTVESSLCHLIEFDADHEPVATWFTYRDGMELDSYLVAIDEGGLWLLTSTTDGTTLTLEHATAPDTRRPIATFDLVEGSYGRFLGVLGELDSALPTFVIGSDLWDAQAIVFGDGTTVMLEGTGRFAGWAADLPRGTGRPVAPVA